MARLGNCQLCNESEAKYKCPRCGTAYCSLACFRPHKITCNDTTKSTNEKETSNEGDPVIQKSADDSPFAILLEDEIIKQQLQYSSLRLHLGTIARLLRDPEFAGEATIEGRKTIALKKLRNLRIGGNEENELVEEFVSRVIHLTSN